MIELTAWLHGKPAQEMDNEGEAVTSKEIADLGITLGARLSAVAAAMKELEAEGWSATMRLYDLSLTHPDVDTKLEARRALKRLGIDKDVFQVEEFEDEEVEA